MAITSFESEMANLDQLQGPPTAVLEEAAKILRIDLGRTTVQCQAELLYTSRTSSQGSKEQWLLRWLLKQLGVADPKSKGGKGDFATSFISCTEFWSLLLNLTCSISDDACAEILLERHFYPALVGFLRQILQDLESDLPAVHSQSTDIEHEGPPAKRRRLSPLPTQQHNSQTLLWTPLQAACRTIDLFSSPSSRAGQSPSITPAWTGSLETQAALLGILLKTVTNILGHGLDGPQKNVAAGMLKTMLTFWEANASSSNAKAEDRQQAFAAQCLTPCLALLDLFPGACTMDKSLAPQANALRRLLALQVVFPLRTTFNEQFTKKWNSTTDVLLYEQMETLLQAYDRLAHSQERGDYAANATSGADAWQLSGIILDVAAQSIPFSDPRRRQQEQRYLDALCIWLVHVTWPLIPRINSTGVLKHDFAEDSGAGALGLEKLLDTALSRKLHISLPVVSYILQAVLSVETHSAPWSLLVKVVQLNPDVLVPASHSIEAKDFLSKITASIESSTVNRDEYNLVRDNLVLPLMRDYARSRALRTFLDTWEQCLTEGLRVRYVSKADQDDIPAVFVWEDDDVFEEFQKLSIVHAPPGLLEKMLEALVAPVKGLRDKVGSTSAVFAKLAIFSALLESLPVQNGRSGFTSERAALLFQGAVDALHRKADFQGQRWRLRKLARLLCPIQSAESLGSQVKFMLSPESGFISFGDLYNIGSDRTGAPASRFLECFECFSLLVEAASKSTQHQLILEAETDHLRKMLAACKLSEKSGWSGRGYDCNGTEELALACIGKLLQCSDILSMYPDIFKQLIEDFVKNATRPLPIDLAESHTRYMHDLQMTMLQDEQAATAPCFRQTIFDCVVIALQSKKSDLKQCQRILQSIAIETMGKVTAEKLAQAMHQRVARTSRGEDMDSLAKDLSYLVFLDEIYPGTFINLKLLDDWWTPLEGNPKSQEASCSPLTVLQKSPLSHAYLQVSRTLKQLFDRVWRKANSAQETSAMSRFASWIAQRVEQAVQGSQQNIPFVCVQSILLCPYTTTSSSNSGSAVRKLRKLCLSMVWHDLKTSLNEAIPDRAILLIRLILNIVTDLHDVESEDDFRTAIAIIKEKLIDHDKSSAGGYSAKQDKLLALSVYRRCLELDMTAEQKPTHVAEGVEHVLSPYEQAQMWTYQTMSALAARADVLTTHTGAAGWAHLLHLLRAEGQHTKHQSPCAVITASVLAHVKQPHLAKDPDLAYELANTAMLNDSSMREPGLLLALKNCKQVLENHPLVINQHTLDQLLSSLQRISSASIVQNNNHEDVEGSPAPEHIYEGICAVLGAVLGRHRRRLSDRHHLLLPVLQALLRCLFWPGTRAIDVQIGNAATAIATFGKILPEWMRSSAEPLPLSSAEYLTRLLSSICNPTVSAARSSNKRHNKLNDEVKKARRSAGQHMQYFIQEYCRDILDGQIAPSMKDPLMPGLYRVMDAIDRDLMRAMNAGMDPSSRAIFKNLYDDWSRYGKWDKS